MSIILRMQELWLAMIEPLFAFLRALLDHFHAATLNGVALLLALLMAFFAGAFFTLRRMRLDAALLWRHVLNPTSKPEAAGPPARAAPASTPRAARALGMIAALYFSMAACMLYFSLVLSGPGIEQVASASGFSAGTFLAGGALAVAFAIVEKRRATRAVQTPRA
ncbi:MAG: hypothetical protein QOE90_1529 [Thermoplasmata archaeon]|jgi:hypothetical protein|nr:hypothetical protein [Thermoplasmata archaeon]